MKISSLTVGFLTILSSQSQWRLVESRGRSFGDTAFFSARSSPNVIPSMRSPQPFPVTHNARQRSEAFPDTRENNSKINPGLFYSVDGKISSLQDTDKNDNLSEVYQTVAEQDPLWYETYVINVLGADTAKDIGLPTLPVVPTSSSKPRPPAETAPIPAKSVEEKLENSKASVDVSERNQPSKDSLEKTTTKNASSSKIPETHKLEKVDERNVAKAEAVLKNDSVPTEKPLVTKDDKDDDEKNMMVLFRDPAAKIPRFQSMPLSTFTALGYSREDIGSLPSDVVALISSDQVRMPRTGNPAQWITSSETSSVQIVPEEEMAEAILKSSTQAAAAQKQKEQQRAKLVSEEAKTATKTTTGQGKQNAPAVKSKSEDAKKKMVAALNVLAGEDSVVTYEDHTTKQLVAMPLAELITLGYSKYEIVQLQPDVLGMIVEGQVKRPRSGLPPNWQQQLDIKGETATSNNIVQIQTKSVFDEMISGTKKSVASATADVESPPRELPSKSSTAEKDLERDPELSKTLARGEPVAASPVKTTKKVQSLTSESKTKEKQQDRTHTEKPLRATAETKTEPKILDKTNLKSSIENASSSVKPDASLRASEAKLSATDNSGNGFKEEKSNNDNAPVEQAQKSATQSKQPTSATLEEPKISLKGSARLTDTPSTNAAQPEAAKIVVFFDYAKGRKLAVPVSKFESLSYTLEEVGDLQADVLATILAESMTKPQTGVPPQWRISKAKSGTAKPEDVQLLSKEDAEKALKTEPVRRSPPSGRRDDAQGPPDTSGRRKQTSQVSSEPNKRRRAKPRSRERQAFNADGSKKSVYSVRGGTPSNKKKRTADPPTPKRWMDIDTFRDLLRTEAELRVSILGDGFSDAIKDESDWRLNLYKDWLWTLDKGIGNPIVPSRRDRTMQVPKSKPPKNNDKPRPKSRSPRRRRDK